MNASSKPGPSERPVDGAEPFTILFARNERCEISTVAVVRGSSTARGQEVIERIKTAITRWVREYKAGASAWSAASGDLNIGDFYALGLHENQSLAECLAAQGVWLEPPDVADEPIQTHYDHVLVNVDELDQEMR